MNGHSEILQFAAQTFGYNMHIDAVETESLGGGHVASSIQRHRLRFVASDGACHELVVVEKHCQAAEVRMLDLLQQLSRAGALPRTIASSCTHDNNGESWFVAPFYAGRSLEFGDSIPEAVVNALAEVHAAFPDGAAANWTWTFDADHMKRTLQNAIDGIQTAELFRATVDDVGHWRGRLEVLWESPVLFAVSDRLQKTLVHGDIHPGNVIVRLDSTPVIIDWAMCGIASPALDLANIE